MLMELSMLTNGKERLVQCLEITREFSKEEELNGTLTALMLKFGTFHILKKNCLDALLMEALACRDGVALAQ